MDDFTAIRPLPSRRQYDSTGASQADLSVTLTSSSSSLLLSTDISLYLHPPPYSPSSLVLYNRPSSAIYDPSPRCDLSFLLAHWIPYSASSPPLYSSFPLSRRRVHVPSLAASSPPTLVLPSSHTLIGLILQHTHSSTLPTYDLYTILYPPTPEPSTRPDPTDSVECLSRMQVALFSYPVSSRLLSPRLDALHPTSARMVGTVGGQRRITVCDGRRSTGGGRRKTTLLNRTPFSRKPAEPSTPPHPTRSIVESIPHPRRLASVSST
ncbi:hypothetical protein R3P38DRAFT_3142081 [Favolaschia claudopus]|uniref:Uncharacterized protein n=1 Tax=Favolaschia claudopus TaxID=2862362 RepID=A0AAV9Z4L7_9AGAR